MLTVRTVIDYHHTISKNLLLLDPIGIQKSVDGLSENEIRNRRIMNHTIANYP
jgi:hypothetical protein